MKKRTFTEEEKKDMVRRYEQKGQDTRMIAFALGTAVPKVRKILHDAGVQMRRNTSFGSMQLRSS